MSQVAQKAGNQARLSRPSQGPNEDSAQVVRKSITCKPEDGSCRLVQGMSEDGRGMVAVPARIRRRSPVYREEVSVVAWARSFRMTLPPFITNLTR